MSVSIAIVYPDSAGRGRIANIGNLATYPDTQVVIDTTTVGENLNAYSVALDHWVSGSFTQEQTATPDLPAYRGTRRRTVTFTNLTPGDKYRVRVAISGDGGGSDTAQRTFIHACCEITYPVSMVSSPENVGVAITASLVSSTGTEDTYPVVLYRPASGPLIGNQTGSWTTTPPTTYPGTPYLHMKVRVDWTWSLDKLVLTWRST